MASLFRSSFILGLLDEEQAAVLVKRQPNPFLLTAFVTALILLFALLWLFVATLDYTVNTNGIVLPLGGVRDARSLASGRVIKLNNTIGDEVWSGTIVAELNDPVREEKWHKQRTLYQLTAAEIEQQKVQIQQEQNNKHAQMLLSLSHNEAQTNILESLVTQLEKAVKERNNKGSRSLKQQRKQLDALHKDYQEFNKKIQNLKKRGYASQGDLIDRLSGYANILSSSSSVERQSYQSAIDYTASMTEVSNLRKEIDRMKLERLTLENSYSQLLQTHKVKLSELHLQKQRERETLLETERSWWRNSVIIAPYDGKLLSFVTGLGSILSLGETYAVIAMRPQFGKQLLTLSPNAHSGDLTIQLDGNTFVVPFNGDRKHFYQTVAEKLRPLLAKSFDYTIGESGLLITSTDQERLRHITITDNQLLDRNKIPVFASLAGIGDNWNATEQINVSIVPPQRAKLIKAGMPMKFLLDHQSQWLDDSRQGEVTSISDYYVTPLELTGLIGSKQIVQEVFREQSGFLVVSHFKNQQGVNAIPVASLTHNKFIISQQSPLRLLVPFLERRISGQPNA